MANDTKRNVEVNLKILNDPASQDSLAKINKSLEKMAATTGNTVKGVGNLEGAYNRLAKMEERSRRLHENADGSFRTNVINRGRSGGQYGGPGAGGGAMAAALMGGSLAAVNASAAIARVGHDSFMTSGQKGRAILRSMPMGGWAMDKIDSFSGRAAGMEKANLLSSFEGVREQGATQLQASRLGMMPQIAGAKSLGQSMRSANPILMGGIDRSTSAGEREFRERSRLIPVEREIAEKQREATAATASRLQAEKEMFTIVKRGDDLAKERASLNQRINRDQGSGTSRQELLKRFEVVNDAIEANRSQREQAWNTIHGAKIAEGQAKGATALSRAQYQGERANILEERAGLAAGQATNFGMMNPFDRARSVEAFKMLQQSKGNTAMLPPDMLQLAMSAGGPAAQKLVEGYGSRTNEYQQMRKLAPDVYAGSPEDLRREAGLARDEQERQTIKAKEEMATTAEKAGENFADMVSVSMIKFVNTAIARLNSNMNLGKNAP